MGVCMAGFHPVSHCRRARAAARMAPVVCSGNMRPVYRCHRTVVARVPCNASQRVPRTGRLLRHTCRYLCMSVHLRCFRQCAEHANAGICCGGNRDATGAGPVPLRSCRTGWLPSGRECLAHLAHGADSTVVTVTVIQLVIMLAMFFSLAQVFSSHRKLALANETIRQLTRITERERIGADLHDIVGQSLTALSLKAQLTGKLLDKETPDATEQARQQLYEMQKLSQEALADVRRVVRDARRLSVAEEISAARELLKTAEIQLIVLGDPLEVDDDAERAAAHVVREAAANIVHHSVAATRCTIQTWQRGVRISDNSPVLPGPAREALTAGGSGLAGLEERVRGADGTLRYGRTKGGWQVEAVFPASQPQGSKSSGEDAVAIQGGDWALPTAVT
ncbi:hypothetical protein DDD63_01135 [Actinobaculum sp. 313]|nr:hypothetical protein DDD63_01135 [Actinobaculum sp. 313]